MECHAWLGLPTRSFLEFVMFSRMFVDALDSEIYEQHHLTGDCYFSLLKRKANGLCESRKWSHAREQHSLKTRRGQMWIKWFTLKSIDEALTEVEDSDPPRMMALAIDRRGFLARRV